MTAILDVQDLEAFYGRTQALHGVTFSMEPGGITTPVRPPGIFSAFRSWSLFFS